MDGRTVNTPQGPIKISAKSDVKEVKILMPDGTETDAKIALKDTDLDLVFLKPEKPASNFKPVPLADTAPMNLLDDIIVIGRMSKELNREPMAATGEIISVIKKPRLFGKISAPATGMPVFNDQGKFLGIGINRLTSKSSGENTVVRTTPSKSRERARRCLFTSERLRPVRTNSVSMSTSLPSACTTVARNTALSLPVRISASLGTPRKLFSVAK